MPLHYLAWKKALAEYGCPFDEQLFYSWGGKPTNVIVATLNQMHGLHMPVEQVAHQKEELYFEMLNTLKSIPDVVEIIEAEHGRIPFAVVSGGRRSSVTRSLNTIGLLDKFDTIVSADDYLHGKPAPDCFLIAAERLGVPPANCLVFEDTGIGIAAATAAGMAHVRVPAPWERN
jgi:HAD superfamily hydrolase (TIGR01509 family)